MISRKVCALAAVWFLVGAATAQDNWKRHSLAKTDMSLELPGEPTAIPLPLSDEVKQKIQQMETYQLQKPNMEVVASYIHYTKDIDVDLNGAVEGGISNLKNGPGVSNFKSKTEETKIGNLPGRRVTGSYTAGGTQAAFEMRVAGEKDRLWQLIVIYEKPAEATAKRVLDSLKIGAAPLAAGAPPAGWKRHALGGVSVELPGEPQKASLDLPESVKEKIKQMETYQMEQDGLMVMANTIAYSEDITANLDGAAEGAISNMRDVPGVSDFKFKQQEQKISDLPGRRLNGTYKAEGKEIGFDMMIAADKNRLWQLIIMRETEASSAGSAAKRVLESLQIKK